MKNPYEVLGVDRQSSKEDITKAYRKLAMTHHPDRGGDEAAFQEIAEAYAIVGDEAKRKHYDTYGLNIEPAVMDMAMTFLTNALNHLLDNADPDSTDFLEGVRKLVRQKQGEIEADIAMHRMRTRKLDRFLARMKGPVLTDVAGREKARLVEETKTRENGLAVIKAAQSLLDNHAYDFNAPSTSGSLLYNYTGATFRSFPT